MFDLDLSIRVLSLEMISSPHPGGADDLRNGPLWATPRIEIAAVVGGYCVSMGQGEAFSTFLVLSNVFIERLEV